MLKHYYLSVRFFNIPKENVKNAKLPVSSPKPHCDCEVLWEECNDYGADLLPQGLEVLETLRDQRIPSCIRSRASVCDLKLKRGWVIQHDNDPKHRSKSTTERRNKRKSALHYGQIRVLTPLPLKCSAVMRNRLLEKDIPKMRMNRNNAHVLSAEKHWLILLAVNKIPQKFHQ